MMQHGMASGGGGNQADTMLGVIVNIFKELRLGTTKQEGSHAQILS